MENLFFFKAFMPTNPWGTELRDWLGRNRNYSLLILFSSVSNNSPNKNSWLVSVIFKTIISVTPVEKSLVATSKLRRTKHALLTCFWKELEFLCSFQDLKTDPQWLQRPGNDYWCVHRTGVPIFQGYRGNVWRCLIFNVGKEHWILILASEATVGKCIAWHSW